MKSATYVIFTLLVCVESFGCHRPINTDLEVKYIGTYLVKRDTEITVAGTGHHIISKDSFLLTINKQTASQINFSSHDNWTATLNKDSFHINTYNTKQTFGVLSVPTQIEVNGFGTFNRDTISYTENVNAGFEIFSGKTRAVGIKQLIE